MTRVLKQQQHQKCSRLPMLVALLTLSLMGIVEVPAPGWAANQIVISYDRVELSVVTVDALETFAKTGEITPEFRLYAELLKESELQDLRQILLTKFHVNSEIIHQFINASAGENLLQRLGFVLRTETNQNGYRALQTALNKVIKNSHEITILDLLRAFPGQSIQLDAKTSIQVVKQVYTLVVANNRMFANLQQLAQESVHPPAPLETLNLLALTQQGNFSWEEEIIQFQNPARNRPSPTVIYFPRQQKNAPVIVISHGLGSQPQTFEYLALHLVSQGFVVVVPEHIDTSTQTLEQVFQGVEPLPDPTSLINRPLDITALLDTLAQEMTTRPTWQNRMNLEQVGVIGQSLGGYTVLALAGATLNLEQMPQHCDHPEEVSQLTFNLSELLQCQALELPHQSYNLRDQRIKAVIGINPMTSLLFGETGMGEIEVPVMLFANTQDYLVPPVAEQIIPFTWLTTPDKYLVLTQPGTHFSYLGKGQGIWPVPDEFVGPDPELAYPYIQALTTAFFQVYLEGKSEYLPALNQSYLDQIGQGTFQLSILQSLTQQELESGRFQRAGAGK